MNNQNQVLKDELVNKIMNHLDESGFTVAFKNTMDDYKQEVYEAANKCQFHYQLNLSKFKSKLNDALKHYRKFNLTYQQNIQKAELKARMSDNPTEQIDPILTISIDELPWRNFVISYISNVWKLDIENTADKDTVDIHWNIPADRFVEKLANTKKN